MAVTLCSNAVILILLLSCCVAVKIRSLAVYRCSCVAVLLCIEVANLAAFFARLCCCKTV